MSRLLLAIILSASLLPLHSLKSQIIFSEDFQNGMPSNFTLIDADGRTVANDPAVNFVTDAWVAYPDFRDNSNLSAYSTSWYNPAGTADDWMITPAIQLDSFAVLEWDAEAYLASYPDGYEVRIAATTDTSDFLANPPVFSIINELSRRVRRRVDLAALGYINQTVHIAFRNNSDDQFLLLIDNIEVKQRPATEVALIALNAPGTGCQLTASETISVDIENFGTEAISGFEVSYVVSSATATDTITETITATILPGDTLRYVFTQPADFSVPGTEYAAYAYISATGDLFSDNNTSEMRLITNVMPHDVSTEYATSFENVNGLLGWDIEDGNNDGYSWFLSSSVPNTGSLSFRYNYNENLPADDWLFSTCLDLAGGRLYRLKFFHRVGASGGVVYPEKLEVKLGMSQTASGMTVLLKDLGALSNTSYEEETIDFTAPSTGTYFIGFHVYSDKDMFFISLDDLTLSEYLLPEASFVSGVSATDILRINFASTSLYADSLHWDFGDGNTSADNPSVSHTYAAKGIYYVCLTAVNQIGSDTYCDSLWVDTLSSTGISMIGQSGFNVYPNPGNGRIYIESDLQFAGDAFIVVHDVMGREVASRAVDSEITTLDISHQPQGIYFVSLYKGYWAARQKIFIVK